MDMETEMLLLNRVFGLSGCGFVMGSIIGGASAFLDCIRHGTTSEILQLKTVRILNTVCHRGRRFGASGGALGALFAGLHGAAVYACHDPYSLRYRVLAGAAAGCAYMSPTGLRGSAVGGAVGGLSMLAAPYLLEILCQYESIMLVYCYQNYLDYNILEQDDEEW